MTVDFRGIYFTCQLVGVNSTLDAVDILNVI